VRPLSMVNPSCQPAHRSTSHQRKGHYHLWIGGPRRGRDRHMRHLSKESCKLTQESKCDVEACLDNHPVRIVTARGGSRKAHVSEQQWYSWRRSGGDKAHHRRSATRVGNHHSTTSSQARGAWQPSLRSSSGTRGDAARPGSEAHRRCHEGSRVVAVQGGKSRNFTFHDIEDEQSQGPVAVQTAQIQPPSPTDWRPTLRHWTS